MKKTFFLAPALLFLTLFTGIQANAQTKDEAGTAYNAVLELSKTDLPGAIAKMQDVIKMCATVGAEADDLKKKAVALLPAWQYNIGNNLLKDKNNDAAMAAYEKSLEFANVYGDANIKEKSEGQLVKLYASKGSLLMKADSMDKAITYFDKSLKIDPEYGKALYAKGQAFKKKGDIAKMLENMELAIASALKTNDTLILKSARNVIGSNLNKEGIDAFNKKSYSEAVTKLTNALSYGFKNKDLYYALASSNNSLKKYDEAIEAANAGMTMDEQTNEKTARYYCEIAKAYEGKKDTPNACANYKKSAFGPFAAFANDKMKNVLKCQ